MSPLPYVRWQVIALAGLIAIAGLFDAALLAICVGGAAVLWLMALHIKYRRDLRITDSTLPPHRERLDRVVLRDPFRMVVPATLFSALFLLGVIDPIGDEAAVYGASSALVVTALAVWGSSLFDWYLILPRISGQLGYRPCRAAQEEEWFPFPYTWKEVTRWWYIHRVVAALIFRLGLSAAIAAVIADLTGFEVLARAAAGLLMLMFGAYAVFALIRGSTLAKEVGQAGHTKGIAGQTVTVDPRPGRRRLRNLWKESSALQIDGRHLVIDVALESIQLAEVEPREETELAYPLRFEKDFESVPLANVDAIRRGKPQFSGCRDRCSGINWYCIENPNCFRPK